VAGVTWANPGGGGPDHDDGPHRREVDQTTSSRAGRIGWDRLADDYQAEHGDFLGDIGFRWGPEGLDESKAGLLGPIGGRRLLEIGCGAAQCSRWALAQGADVVALDLSGRQLQHSRRIDADTGLSVPVIQADAVALPVADGSVDVAFSCYGALPFLADAEHAMREVHRVLRPGGRWVFSVAHPIRWAFPDDPGPAGLTATGSYFDRRAYVEQEAGRAVYVEHHRTVGDWVRAVVGASMSVIDLVEPAWPTGHDRTWGGWSPLRGRHLPGTLIVVAERR
jgi:SAM-dependent methyltransferase